MRFGIFYEHQLPRPWAPDDEHRLLTDALEQVELADRLGIDYLWLVEHHFLEEYSHSSAPEVFLAAASQRTSRIRLGHGIVQLPPAYNHPARVAERVATLDLLSDGRVEFGTGESSSEVELGGFGVARQDKRAQWEEALGVVTRMLVEEPFAGHQGKFIEVPPRNLVPKPLQRPHPPLWVACSRRETIHLAATKGVGALSFSFIEPDRAREWVDDYYATIASEACVPGGFAVNPQVACVLPLLCHQDEETAIQRGLDGAHFFGYALAHYYVFGAHRPGRTSIWDEFQANRSSFGFDREIAAQTGVELGAQLLQEGLGSLRGAIGTPAQIRELIRGYQAAGVDQLVFVSQAGRTRHEHICESLELFARDVMPEFAETADEQDHAKAERLQGAIEAALARREPPRVPPAEYTVNPATQF
jgi:alkanesulfonate monooxygenase SsuD/methylene tetrahydromethanopterin reductase-like flavin-dependent oxidoreductase (luciferase family)